MNSGGERFLPWGLLRAARTPLSGDTPQRPAPCSCRCCVRRVGSTPAHRQPGTVFAFRSSSVTAALRYGRLHSTRRNADRSRVPLLPPTAKRVGTVWHTVPRGLEGSAPLAMLASHVPHLLRRPPEASIAPPFIASPFCDESYTVLGSFPFTASHSPPLGDAILPSTVRFFYSQPLVERFVRSSAPRSDVPGVHGKMGIPEGALLPFGIFP